MGSCNEHVVKKRCGDGRDGDVVQDGAERNLISAIKYRIGGEALSVASKNNWSSGATSNNMHRHG